jgi:glutathione S-transferase
MTALARCTLFGENLWISPYVFSTFVALREKGIPFEVVEVELAAGDHLKPAYSDASLTARVPSLDHDAFRLSESSAIAEYLDEVFPAPLYSPIFPTDRQARARARQLMAWLRSDLGGLRAERPTVTMFYRFRVPELSPAAVGDAQKLIRVADQLVPPVGGPLFGSWCLADSELAFALHRLLRNGDAVPNRIRAYAESQWSRPSVRAFAEHARPAVVPDSYWAFSGTAKPSEA